MRSKHSPRIFSYLKSRNPGIISLSEGIRLGDYHNLESISSFTWRINPEVMNVLPLLKTDLVEVCNALINQDLNKIKLDFEDKATVCKYLVPEGYPESPITNMKIEVGRIPEKTS